MNTKHNANAGDTDQLGQGQIHQQTQERNRFYLLFAVLHAWELRLPSAICHEVDGIFYANDGKLGSHRPAHIQQSLDIMVELFLCMGLCMNAAKTKTMITKGCVPVIKQSTLAYIC